MKRCAYYVTGHGYGHATRSFTVIKKLLEHGFSVILVSSLSNEFVFQSNNFGEYENYYQNKFRYENRKLDTGGKQIGPLLLDLHETLNIYYRDIFSSHDELVDYEVNFLKKNEIQLVLCDATPLACIAGKLANAKTILLTNLSWDVIYKDMLSILQSTSTSHDYNQLYSHYNDMLTQIISDYSEADFYFQLPGLMTETPLLSLENCKTSIINNLPMKIKKCPLICRTFKIRKGDILDHYNISIDKKILLLSFGGHDLNEFMLKEEYLPSDWICLLIGFKQEDYPDLSSSNSRFIFLEPDTYVPDFVNICHAFLGKIGYGTVSECLGTLPVTPLIYIPRPGWSEEPYLQKLLSHNNCGLEMSASDFYQGKWDEYLNKALSLASSAKKYTPLEKIDQLLLYTSSVNDTPPPPPPVATAAVATTTTTTTVTTSDNDIQEDINVLSLIGDKAVEWVINQLEKLIYTNTDSS